MSIARRFPAASIAGRRTWDPLTAGSLASGLILDLCPDYASTVVPYLSSGKITRIDDRSTQGNNFVQATGSAQPTYNSTDAIYGGRASMTWSGAQQLASAANMNGYGGTTGSTICVVHRWSAVSAIQMLVNTASGYPFPPNAISLLLNTPNAVHQSFRGGALQFNYNTSPTPTFGVTYRRVVTSDIGSAVSAGAHYVNGSLVGSGTASGTGSTFTADKWYIGAIAGVYYMNLATFARVLAWNRILNSTELAALDTGLKSFFSL